MDPQTHPSDNGQNNNLPPMQPQTLQVPPMPGAGLGPNDGDVTTAGAPAPEAPPMDAAAASWLPPTVPVQASASGQPTATSGQPIVPAPSVADDGDVIEKEWVMKAKRIVDQTRQDPYKQTKELHKFRAEYMKKRYNKVIEPVDE